MGLFDKIRNLFDTENEYSNVPDNPFSALLPDDLDDDEKEKILNSKYMFADEPPASRDEYGNPLTPIELKAKIMSKLSEERVRFAQTCNGTEERRKEFEDYELRQHLNPDQIAVYHATMNNTKGPRLMDTLDKLSYSSDFFKKKKGRIERYEEQKRNTLRDLMDKSYPEIMDGIFWMIDNYPKLPYSMDKKYFPTFRHNAGPLDPIKDYMVADFSIRKGDYGEEGATSNSKSLLDSPETMPLAEILSTFLARKSVELHDLGSVRDCVTAFAQYNAKRILENGFDTQIIVPKAFKDPKFKDLLQENGATDELYFLETDTIRDWMLKAKEEKNLFTISPLMQKDWEKIFDKWDFPEIQNSVCGVDNEVSIEEMKKHKALSKANAAGQVDGIFVDVDGTLILPNGLNKRLYEIMLLLKGTEKVTIFTGGDIALAKKHLQDIGVDINAFPIESKDNYRNFLFTGIIIDDVEPEHQAFWMNDEERYISERSVNLDFLKVAAQKRANGENKPLLTLFDEAKENLEGLNPLLRGMMERARRRG